jgi:hypothetical protein
MTAGQSGGSRSSSALRAGSSPCAPHSIQPHFAPQPSFHPWRAPSPDLGAALRSSGEHDTRRSCGAKLLLERPWAPRGPSPRRSCSPASQHQRDGFLEVRRAARSGTTRGARRRTAHRTGRYRMPATSLAARRSKRAAHAPAPRFEGDQDRRRLYTSRLRA